MKNKLVAVLWIALKLWIGVKFVMEGLEKFESLERFAGRSSPFLDFYLAMAETGYMFPLLGVVEIVGGALLVSQRYSFLGALMLLPIMLNVWLAHVLLIQSPMGITLMSAMFAGLLLLLFKHNERLKLFVKPNKIWPAKVK